MLAKGICLPDFVIEATAAPLPLSAISYENWLSLCYELYSECRVKKNGANYRADNVILFNAKYLPVEIKLNINNEPALIGQLEQYCGGEIFLTQNSTNALNPERVHANRVLVIDTEGVYLYDTKSLTLIRKLSEVRSLEDLARLRDILTLSV